MRKKKLSSDGHDSGSKKYKTDYDGTYGGVWRNLRLAGVWSQAVGFMLVRWTVALKMFHIYFTLKKGNLMNFILPVQSAKITMQ
jgi:hypothetical protein